jgi:hypothetical protein
LAEEGTHVSLQPPEMVSLGICAVGGQKGVFASFGKGSSSDAQGNQSESTADPNSFS